MECKQERKPKKLPRKEAQWNFRVDSNDVNGIPREQVSGSRSTAVLRRKRETSKGTCSATEIRTDSNTDVEQGCRTGMSRDVSCNLVHFPYVRKLLGQYDMGYLIIRHQILVWDYCTLLVASKTRVCLGIGNRSVVNLISQWGSNSKVPPKMMQMDLQEADDIPGQTKSPAESSFEQSEYVRTKSDQIGFSSLSLSWIVCKRYHGQNIFIMTSIPVDVIVMVAAERTIPPSKSLH